MEFEAWNRNRRNLSPNHFLIWEAIKLFHSEGYPILDFGRTSIRNVSLIDFKRRWGTEAVDLPSFFYPANSQGTRVDREDTTSYKLMRRVCKRAPNWALNFLGEFAYRHLG
jgi:serine/alanine adding enzyme